MRAEKILYRWVSRQAKQLVAEWHKHERLKRRREWYMQRQNTSAQQNVAPSEPASESEVGPGALLES